METTIKLISGPAQGMADVPDASVDIDTGEILGGSLTSRSLSLVREWIGLHRVELSDLWLLAQARKPLYRIDPLEYWRAKMAMSKLPRVVEVSTRAPEILIVTFDDGRVNEIDLTDQLWSLALSRPQYRAGY